MSPSAINTPMERPEVEIAPRRPMTEARKARIHAREKGKCWMCGRTVPVSGTDVRYDHKLPLELGGSDDDANIFPLHREPCDRLKTAADATRIATAKRQGRKHRLDVERPASARPLKSRSSWPPKGSRKIGSRPFPGGVR